MKQSVAAALGVAIALSSASALAADDGSFFVNAGVGQARYHFSRDYSGGTPGVTRDDKDNAGALRFGYAWRTGANFDFGVEGGYLDAGKATEDINTDYLVAQSEIRVTGWMLGMNGKLHFAEKWYLGARGGWVRTRDTFRTRIDYAAFDTSNANLGRHENDSGWYAGAGVGYDITPDISVGLHYDHYGEIFRSSNKHNLATYMVTAEYRF